jgi:hypothetical protein
MKKQVRFDPNPDAVKSLALDYSANAQQELYLILLKLSEQQKFDIKDLANWQNTLLFIRTHASEQKVLKVCERIFIAITRFLKGLGSTRKTKINDTFLPYSQTSLIFSFTFIEWLNTQKDCLLKFDGMEAESGLLNGVLKATLPNPEKDICAIGYEVKDLWKALKIKEGKELDFLLQQFQVLHQEPILRDFVWDQLKIWTNISAIRPSFSKLYNRLPMTSYFYHDGIFKRFDPMEWYQKKLPRPEVLDAKYKTILIEVIRKAMVHSMRETDPATYMQEESLTYYQLERGISIALFDVTAERQLPFQSYIGYTLFKNGYPMAYGGSWVMGQKAHFGINIFDQFRGGESAFVMCQLLRTYIQLFNLKQIEVDSYQFGKNNEDGIKSAAFWFYYRFGFRPIDLKLASLARTEFNKIQGSKKYKSSRNTLLKLAESNMVLNLGPILQISYEQINAQITKTIAQQFKGDRIKAIAAGKKFLRENLEVHTHETEDTTMAWQEASLLVIAYKNKFDKQHQEAIKSYIEKKPNDYLGFQSALTRIITIQ